MLRSTTPRADRCASAPLRCDSRGCRWSHIWSPRRSLECRCICRVEWGSAHGNASLKDSGQKKTQNQYLSQRTRLLMCYSLFYWGFNSLKAEKVHELYIFFLKQLSTCRFSQMVLLSSADEYTFCVLLRLYVEITVLMFMSASATAWLIGVIMRLWGIKEQGKEEQKVWLHSSYLLVVLINGFSLLMGFVECHQMWI